MKKLMFIVVLCCVTLGGWAQKIKLESGSLDFLKNEKLLAVKFTYDGMGVGKMTEDAYLTKKVDELNAKEPGRGDQFRQSWVNDRTTRFEPKFRELFDKYMVEKGLATGPDGNYTLVVNTHFTEPGFNVGVARKNASISAAGVFIHNETGEEVARVSIENSSANDFWGADFDTGYRIQESYGKAGRELAKFLVKKVKW